MSSNLYDKNNDRLIPYAGSAKTSSLDEVDDVEINSPTDGQVLRYDETNNQWINANPSPALPDMEPTEDSLNYVTSGGLYTKFQDVNADINKAYKSDDSTESAMDDADYIPFYDTSAQTKKKILKPNLVGKVLTAQTLAIGATTLTFTDSSIGNNSRIRVISNPFTLGLLNAVQNGNTVTLTFDAQEVALSVTLEVRN